MLYVQSVKAFRLWSVRIEVATGYNLHQLVNIFLILAWQTIKLVD